MPQEGLSRSFTDFAKWQPYPGRGTQLIPGVWQGVTPFHDFYAGVSRDVPQEFREGLVDSVRWFLEDCDSPQGIQCFVDGTGGFGSLAAECLNVRIAVFVRGYPLVSFSGSLDFLHVTRCMRTFLYCLPYADVCTDTVGDHQTPYHHLHDVCGAGRSPPF